MQELTNGNGRNDNGNRFSRIWNAFTGNEQKKVLGLPEAAQLYTDINGAVETGGPAVPIAIISTAQFFGVDITLFQEADQRRDALNETIARKNSNLVIARGNTADEIGKLRARITSAECELQEFEGKTTAENTLHTETIGKVDTVAEFFTQK